MPMKGLDGMVKKLRTIAAQYPDRVADALYEESEIEMKEMKRRVPVAPPPGYPPGHSGTLRDSGQVHEPVIQGKIINVPMSFGATGSGAEDYAVIQHENLDFDHPYQGEAKYMESVLNESRQYMKGRLAARLHFDNFKS